MNTLTEAQLEILSKVNDLQGLANMTDLINGGSNLEILGWDDEIGELFQKKLLKINGPGYRLTPLGEVVYNRYLGNLKKSNSE